MVRLIGSGGLILIALTEDTTLFLVVFVVLMVTDWLDGKLAIYLDQKTDFGARLDSVADTALYTALFFGTCWLRFDVVADESVWLVAIIISFVVTSGAGLLKYGKIPSYHTRTAKTGWLFVGIAVISVFAEWSIWPLRAMALCVILTNLEALAITCVLPTWTPNVTSIFHAIRRAKAQ